MEEKKHERKLIKKLKEYGFYAVHMDTGVPGFPDILCIRNGEVAFIEVKDAARGVNPSSLFEKTQPSLYCELAKHGMAQVFLARCSKAEVNLHSIHITDSLRPILLDEVLCSYNEFPAKLAEILEYGE
jgi:Holliday junction resolvase